MSLLGDLGTAIKNKLGGTSVDNTVPRYDGTTCKLQGSGVTISDTNVVTASGGFVGSLTGNASTATNVSGGKATVYGTGNDYHLGGVEVVGNGPDNTVFPTIGFHQPQLYASSLQLRGSGDFRFYTQGGASYANVTANTFIGNLSGNANTSGYATTAGRAYPRRSDGADLNFYWSGQGGQPTWLWGGNDGANMYVYNPSNFSVNYATSATYAATAAVGTNDTQIATTAFVANAVTSSVPVSTIIAIANGVVPTGFLECNGATISRSTYSALFSKISTLYGAGDGSTTFKIPDLRGEFIRGWDNSRGVDTSRGIGSSQTGATRLLMNGSATGNNPEGNSTTGIITHKPGVEMIGIEATFWGSYTNRVTLRNAMDTTWGGASETRPRNVAMMYCIKY